MRDSAAIQVALFERLSGALSAPVYDEVPPRAVTPYVVLGEGTEIPADTHDAHGSEETVTVHVWSRRPGSSECRKIMGELSERLHQVTVQLSDLRRVRVTREFAEMFTDETEPGERWRHGVMRLRVRTLEGRSNA